MRHLAAALMLVGWIVFVGVAVGQSVKPGYYFPPGAHNPHMGHPTDQPDPGQYEIEGGSCHGFEAEVGSTRFRIMIEGRAHDRGYPILPGSNPPVEDTEFPFYEPYNPGGTNQCLYKTVRWFAKIPGLGPPYHYWVICYHYQWPLGATGWQLVSTEQENWHPVDEGL